MDAYNNVLISKELLLEFFMTFARFEFALKASGYAKGCSEDGYLSKISPDWDSYANTIKDAFNITEDNELEKAVDYFFYHPPRRQVMIDNEIAWDTSAPDTNLSIAEQLLLLVRRVRNNLFHGGKFCIDVHESRERTELLLKFSLVILDHCLPIIPKVQLQFEQASM